MPAIGKQTKQFPQLPDDKGHFGDYGGIYVAETLIPALQELRDAFYRYREDPDFVAVDLYADPPRPPAKPRQSWILIQVPW